MITKDMAKPDSEWMKKRNEFEKLYDEHTKDFFLDCITTMYIVKEVDAELATEPSGGIKYDLHTIYV